MAVDRLDGERPRDPFLPPESLDAVPLDDMPSGQSESARMRWNLLVAINRLRDLALASQDHPELTVERGRQGIFLAQVDTVLSLLERLDASGYLIAVDGR